MQEKIELEFPHRSSPVLKLLILVLSLSLFKNKAPPASIQCTTGLTSLHRSKKTLHVQTSACAFAAFLSSAATNWPNAVTREVEADTSWQRTLRAPVKPCEECCVLNAITRKGSVPGRVSMMPCKGERPRWGELGAFGEGGGGTAAHRGVGTAAYDGIVAAHRIGA